MSSDSVLPTRRICRSEQLQHSRQGEAVYSLKGCCKPAEYKTGFGFTLRCLSGSGGKKDEALIPFPPAASTASNTAARDASADVEDFTF
ncbi:hypothetical protein F7725_009158 [Dissostichus mawsoni]|uniref:Uncharacterized protein n=1 Tax=Dissostichus mawsoni TaxID=36200 RepID=A0A7J5Z881_DISMA|nr:hypothetical protein F7725_009158 [Dissostichus mawsoni]